MLSRVAESLYWMSRYIERAENTARLLDVNLQLLADFEGYVDGDESDFWSAIVYSTGEEQRFLRQYGHFTAETVIDFLTNNADNPASLASSINLARENARMIRDQISHEMWECINTLYHYHRNNSPDAASESLPYSFFDRIKQLSYQFLGLTEAIYFHEEGYRFIQLGRFLERTDQTTRMIDLKHFLPIPDNQEAGGTVDVAGWVAVLRSCSAVDAFQTAYLGDVGERNVADFLILSPTFPRSIRFCLRSLDYSVRAISGSSQGTYSNSAEKAIGRLANDIVYTTVDDILKRGLHDYVDQIQLEVINVHNLIFETYFDIPKINLAEEIETQRQDEQQ